MSSNARLHPRGSTIFWGIVLLLVASVAGITSVFAVWTWTSTVWLIIAFGALMVVAGVIGGIARAVSRPEASGTTEASETSGPTVDTASTDRLTPNSTDAPLT